MRYGDARPTSLFTARDQGLSLSSDGHLPLVAPLSLAFLFLPNAFFFSTSSKACLYPLTFISQYVLLPLARDLSRHGRPWTTTSICTE